MSVSEISTRDQFDCNGCRYRFSVTSGTIFDNTNLPLWKWFVTIYLICESKKSISANQIKRTIGVTYKTAWHLCQRIRSAMRGHISGGPTLFGVVEVDETLVGGKRRGVGTGNRVGKTWVAGAVQRGGEVRIEAVPNIKRATLHAFIARNTRPDTEAIYTDELKSYLGIADHYTRHETGKHSEEEWVGRRCPHEQRRGRLEPSQALYRRSLAPGQCQAPGRLPVRSRVQDQPPERPLHLRGRPDPPPGRPGPSVPRVDSGIDPQESAVSGG